MFWGYTGHSKHLLEHLLFISLLLITDSSAVINGSQLFMYSMLSYSLVYLALIFKVAWLEQCLAGQTWLCNQEQRVVVILQELLSGVWRVPRVYVFLRV